MAELSHLEPYETLRTSWGTFVKLSIVQKVKLALFTIWRLSQPGKWPALYMYHHLPAPDDTSKSCMGAYALLYILCLIVVWILPGMHATAKLTKLQRSMSLWLLVLENIMINYFNFPQFHRSIIIFVIICMLLRHVQQNVPTTVTNGQQIFGEHKIWHIFPYIPPSPIDR